MKMKISDPGFLIPGSLEDLKKDFPSCLETHISSERKNIQRNVTEKSTSLLFSFPSVSREIWHVISLVAVYLGYICACARTHVYASIFIYLFYLYRILLFMGEQHFPGLFGFILHFLEISPYIYLYITRWKAVRVTWFTAHCGCSMMWR